MFVLDTNVLSAIMGSAPVPEVAAWVTAQPEKLLFTVSVCQAEVLAGIEVLPEGRRRHALEAAARAILTKILRGGCCRSMEKPRRFMLGFLRGANRQDCRRQWPTS